jgi:hypothetical protein
MPFDPGLASQLKESLVYTGDGLAPLCSHGDIFRQGMLVRGLWFFGFAFSLLLHWWWKFVGGLKN